MWVKPEGHAQIAFKSIRIPVLSLHMKVTCLGVNNAPRKDVDAHFVR